MISLDGFWGFVTYRPGLSATALEWSAHFGDDGWDILRPPLFTGDGIAPACRPDANGRALQVVRMSGNQYGLVCSTTGNLEQSGLTESDVKSYRLNVTALRSMIATALDITPDPERVPDVTRAVPIGSWSPAPGANIPAFMMLAPTAIRLASEIRRLLGEIEGGFILFVPNTPQLESTLRDCKKINKANESCFSLSQQKQKK